MGIPLFSLARNQIHLYPNFDLTAILLFNSYWFKKNLDNFMDLPADILNQFSWHEISIQKDISGNCFLILASTEEKSQLIYDIMSNSAFRLEVQIDPITKIYSFRLVFRYNKIKDIEYSYDTKLTSEMYPPLVWLTNGTVKFITTGMQSDKDQNLFSYRKPLLNLECQFYPN